MAHRKNRNGMKPSSLKIADSKPDQSDIQQTNKTPSTAPSELHLTKVGKGGCIKHDPATSSRSHGFKDSLGTNDEDTGWQLLAGRGASLDSSEDK